MARPLPEGIRVSVPAPLSYHQENLPKLALGGQNSRVGTLTPASLINSGNSEVSVDLGGRTVWTPTTRMRPASDKDRSVVHTDRARVPT